MKLLHVCLAVLALSIPALAAVQTTPQGTFDVTIKPQTATTAAYPRTGILTLKFNSDGIVNGTYRGTSIAPDPLNNRITSVTGGLREHNLWINIGSASLHFSGTLKNERLSMSGWIKGRLYSLHGNKVR